MLVEQQQAELVPLHVPRIAKTRTLPQQQHADPPGSKRGCPLSRVATLRTVAVPIATCWPPPPWIARSRACPYPCERFSWCRRFYSGRWTRPRPSLSKAVCTGPAAWTIARR